MIIRMNVNAMTKQEILQQYRSLIEQAENIKKRGYVVGEEFHERIAILKKAIDEKGLT